jgi:hypothetical protein
MCCSIAIGSTVNNYVVLIWSKHNAGDCIQCVENTAIVYYCANSSTTTVDCMQSSVVHVRPFIDFSKQRTTPVPQYYDTSS